MLLCVLASEMQGDRVGDYGAVGGIVGFIVVALWLYIIADGPTSRRGGKK